MPKNNTDKSKVAFSGYRSPHYTIVPDELFDEQMVDLSGSELKVLLYIIRHTFGFKKDDDNIAISQMLHGIVRRDGTIQDRGCGLSKPALLQALRDLQERNLVIAERRMSREKGNEPTNYRLNMLVDPRTQAEIPPLVKKVDQGVGQKTLPSPWSRKLTTQETTRQETTEQKTETSNSFDIQAQKSNKPLNFEKSKKRDKIDRNVSQQAAEPTPQHRSSGGMKPIGELLERHTPVAVVTNGSQQPPQPPRRGRPPKYPATPAIEALLTDWTHELHDDPEHAQSNVSQAARLWHESGVSEDTFHNLLYEARRRTKQAGNVEKLADGEAGELGFRNRAPYFFACLKKIIREDLQRQVQDRAPATGKGKSSSKKGARTPDVRMGNV